ncbi:MAG: PEGA domain-containing protein [Planctomycetes bacterium]|jgi:Tol biopolymer transport system component|nr:PEGA domain-containing protein [Planctomycetota bacterium]
MSLKFRRILYIIFILAFLIITPLVSFYAVGYKLNSRFQLEKTGALIIDTTPSGAKIYLDEKPQYGLAAKFFWQTNNYIKTPAKIKNILPGEYAIRLELENYWPWQKKLTVQPGQATFAETVNLFKKDLPLLIWRGEYYSASYQPPAPEIILQSSSTVLLLDESTGESASFTPATATHLFFPAAKPAWSPDGKRILIGLYLFSQDDWEKPVSLEKILGPDAVNLKWSEDSTGIYYRKNNSLYHYSLAARLSATVSAQRDFYDYWPQNNHIYLVSGAGQYAELAVYDKKYEKIRQINLPHSAYLFLEQDTAWVNFYDTTHRTLYLIDPFSDIKPLYDIINNVTLAKWVNEHRLLYANESEIWLYDSRDGRKTLLTRLSREITDIFWHPSNNYIIFTTSDSVNIIELDDREKRSITEILNLPDIKWPHLNDKGDALYFYARIGNQPGLYKLAIQ